MFDDDNNDETTPEHVKRLRAEREKYEEERANASAEAGENCGQEWAQGADYAALQEWAERAEATHDFEHASLPDAGWEDLPEDGDAPSYARGFLGTVIEVFEEVEAEWLVERRSQTAGTGAPPIQSNNSSYLRRATRARKRREGVTNMTDTTTGPPSEAEVLAAIKWGARGSAERTDSTPEQSAAEILNDALQDWEEQFEGVQEEYGSSGVREAAVDYGHSFFGLWLQKSPPKEAAAIIAGLLRDPSSFEEEWEHSVNDGDVGLGFAEGFVQAAEWLCEE